MREGERRALSIGRKHRLALIYLAENVHQILLDVVIFEQLALAYYG